jgi:Tat protein secretion system quality control protein TatD with DNase activity
MPSPTLKPTLLSLIDVHNHLPRGLTMDYLVKLMDESSVKMTVLMPVFYGGNDPRGQGISDENLVLEFYKKRPDRIIPFLGMQRPWFGILRRWQQPDAVAENLLQFAESQLRTGLFRGIGEFILWHYPYSYPSGAQGGTVKIPADTPLMKRFLDLAVKYQVPVNIHYEIDQESLPSLKKMLEYGRQTTIILAHNGGRADCATLQALLEEYPNILIDWGGMTHFGGYGRTSPPREGITYFVKNPIEDGTGHLRPEWKVFFERYPDRVVGIGFDGAHPEGWTNPQFYKRNIATFRTMLSDLSPETAQKIGYKNAQKLFVPAKPPTGLVPLIDAHSHVPPDASTLKTIINPLLDQAGVTKIVLMGHQPQASWPIGEEDKLTLKMYESNPNRVIPFLCCIRWGLAMRDRAWLKYADQQLATGKFRGIGQLIVKRYRSHDPKDPDKDISNDVPWDSTWAQDLMRLAAKHNVPLMFMMESTPETLLALDRALQQNPNTKFIWNHQNQLQDRIGSIPEARALSGDPQRVATLLEKYRNLFIDLTIGRDTVIRTASDRQIPANWKNLYEKYRDRIIIGVDAEVKEGVEKYYLSEVGWMRSWLFELSNDTAKKLAYENIERILSARP